MGVIYLLYNEEGQGYIGQTINIKRRLKDHKSKNQNTKSKMLGNFKCEILEECDDDYLEDYEQYYYDFYNEMFPNMLVNKNRPKQSIKEYLIKNKDKRNKNSKNYYNNNKTQILEEMKQKRIENIDEYREKDKKNDKTRRIKKKNIIKIII